MKFTDAEIEAKASEIALAEGYNPNKVDPRMWAEFADYYRFEARRELIECAKLQRGPGR
jgi:hypothetical protein